MIRVIHKGEREYPKRLLPYERMPERLYMLGKLPDEQVRTIAIVGARASSAYGRSEAKRFARILSASGVEVISGMADGIDAAAHEGALAGSGRTTAVLGCGVDVCYPKTNLQLYRRIAAQGCILSEFEPGSEPLAYHFPLRNRIISGLADLVLVIEARRRSGSLITAELALEQGKNVFAVPGRNSDPVSAGCNALIAQGAGIAVSPEQLLEVLHMTPIPIQQSAGILPTRLEKDALASAVLSVLQKKEASIGFLVNQLGATPQKMSEILLELCLCGAIREVRSGIYTGSL